MKIISKYCEECVLFINKKCEGKSDSHESATFWGTPIKKSLRSGCRFCNQYEFDMRFYTFDDGSRFGHADTISVLRERQVTKDKETSEQSHSDNVDLSETLSSTGLENLI